MGKVLVIGCGGVAGVAIQKCAQNDAVFDEICIASRTVSKCDALKEKLEGKTNTVSGSDNHGCLPGNRRTLCGHSKL